MPVNYVITLVHGTFAQNARWTHPESIFSKKLLECLDGASVVLIQFKWSGLNSSVARRKAAVRLRRQLISNGHTYPEARHLVIGHSHGGTIAVKAVGEMESVSNIVNGIATLSTPFIHAQERSADYWDYAKILHWAYGLVLSFFSSVGMFELLGKIEPTIETWGLSWELVVVLGTLSLGGMVTLHLSKIAAKWTLRCSKIVRSDLDCEPPQALNLLIIRFSGDEASSLLAISHFFSWIVGRLWRVMGIIFSPYRRLLQFVDASWKRQLILASSLVFTWDAFYWSPYPLSDGHSYSSWFLRNVDKTINDFFTQLWEGFYQSAEFIFALAEPGEFHVEHLGGILFFSFVLLGAVVMATAVCVCCLLGLLFAILLPFGPSTVLANILAEVSVEPVPRGVWAVHQFASAGSIHESLTGLAHSASYHDPRVISLIARWIKGEDGKKLTRARQNLPDL